MTRSAAAFVLVLLALNVHPAHAQGRDGFVNGAAAGAAVGAGLGVAFTHAVRDSDLGFGQYAYGALVFGGIGAGVGLGIDALLDRRFTASGVPPTRMTIAPAIWRNVTGVTVRWRW